MLNPQDEWGKYSENIFVKKLSQEHGTISAHNDYIRQKKVGDIIFIIPVHSCMTAQSMGKYSNFDGALIDHL